MIRQSFDDVVATATALARNCGYAVFPCKRDKTPATPHGFKDAVHDPDAIGWLWACYPGPLIGVATGEASGISVLDVDGGRWADDATPEEIAKREGARAWWHANARHLPATRIYETASGGLHVIFRHHPVVNSTQSKISQGVDTRGVGGYIVWWFAHGYACHDHSPTAEWPEWLLSPLTTKERPPRPSAPSRHFRESDGGDVKQVIRTALRRVHTATEGKKHETLRGSALLLGGIQQVAGFSDADAVGWLRDALPDTVKDWRNVKSTVLWGLANGRAKPLNASRARR
jgi:hypothetical protein